MEPTAEQIERVVRELEAMPMRLDRLLRGQDERATRRAPAAGAWSALETLVHLRAAADIVTPRVYAILTRDDPPLPAFDERRWAEVGGYAELPVNLLLSGFTGRRTELVRLLRRLPAADWTRPGRHEVHGAITLFTIVEQMAAHEAEHLTQMRAAMAR